MLSDVHVFSVALRPQRPKGLLGTGAQDGHLNFHTAPELSLSDSKQTFFCIYIVFLSSFIDKNNYVTLFLSKRGTVTDSESS